LNNKEVRHAPKQRHHCPPPRQLKLRAPVALDRFWVTLSDESRQRALTTLSRVVIQQLSTKAQPLEVAHERP
jgi:hypothetical protein